MAKTLSLTNLVDIECDSIMIKYKDIYDIFLTKEQGSDIVGLSPDDLNTLQEIANAIGNDERGLVGQDEVKTSPETKIRSSP